MNESFVVPDKEIAAFGKGIAMNKQEGMYLYGIADPSIAKLLPPPLTLPDPEHPMAYIYIVDIKEPTFAPRYAEGGIGVIAQYEDVVGLYFFNVMLSGPGALMGAYIGRETSGLPKKLCESIVAKREGDHAHAYIERGGVRLVDVEIEIGSYNIPDVNMEQEKSGEMPEGMLLDGGCLLYRYRFDAEVGARDMQLVFYDSPTRYFSWEPASATVKLASTPDDPWGSIPLQTVLGAAWSKCDNSIAGTTLLHKYPDSEAAEVMRYLFAGRYDQTLLKK